MAGTRAFMANSDDTLLREVEEELRRERMEQLWKQYGTYFLLGAIAIVVGVGGFQFYKWRESSAAFSSGAAFERAIGLADDGKRDEARSALDSIATSGPSGYSALARLRLAAAELEAGDKTKALASYEALAAASGADPLLKSFAKLQAAALKIGEADFTEVENRLNDLTAESSPWRASARELIALAALKAGKQDAARKALEQVLADRSAPADVRERVQIMLGGIIANDLAAKAPAAK